MKSVNVIILNFCIFEKTKYVKLETNSNRKKHIFNKYDKECIFFKSKEPLQSVRKVKHFFESTGKVHGQVTEKL